MIEISCGKKMNKLQWHRQKYQDAIYAFIAGDNDWDNTYDIIKIPGERAYILCFPQMFCGEDMSPEIEFSRLKDAKEYAEKHYDGRVKSKLTWPRSPIGSRQMI